MKWLKGNVESILTVLAIIGMVVGGLSYFAKSEDLNLVDLRLEQKIVGDAIYQISMQMGQLEDKHGNDNCSRWNDARDRERYRKLRLQLESLKKKQDAIINEQTRSR